MAGLWLNENRFRYDVEDNLTLIKSEGNDDSLYNSRKHGGYFSTSESDRQGEEVIQKGLIVKPFAEYGFYNDNHSPDTDALVGFPELVELKKGGWYNEGYIIKGTKRADNIWELAKALDKIPDPKRRLGYSVEGSVLERKSGSMIVKARVDLVAITNRNVNPGSTWNILKKSFCSCDGSYVCSGCREQMIKSGVDINSQEQISNYSSTDGKIVETDDVAYYKRFDNMMYDFNRYVELRKARHALSKPEIEELLYLSNKLFKALSTSSGATATQLNNPVIPEDLEKDDDKKKKKKSLKIVTYGPDVLKSFNDVIDRIQDLRPHLSRAFISKVVRYVVTNKAKS